MRQNYKANKMRREEAKKKKKEEKRLERLSRKDKNITQSADVETVSGETYEGTSDPSTSTQETV